METDTPSSNEKAGLKDLLRDVAISLSAGDSVSTYTYPSDGRREVHITFDNSKEGLRAFEAIGEFLAYCNNQYQFRSMCVPGYFGDRAISEMRICEIEAIFGDSTG